MPEDADVLVLDLAEQRVLGALLEKQRTVPETYPLSLNALRTACNQSTSRDPVTSYDDATLVEVLGRLRERELVRFVKPTGLRVVKYHQRLEERLGLSEAEAALVAVLLLRGDQSPGELRPRTERLHAFASREDVEETLHALAARPVPLVIELDRRPGQHDRRWRLLLAERPAADPAVPAEPAPDLEEVLAEGGAPARDRRVAAEYERLAAAYAEALADDLAGKPFERWLLDRLAADAGEGQALDVGCGPGQVAGHLAGLGLAVTALDVAGAMLAEVRRRHPEVTTVQGSLAVPPMPRGGDPRDPGWALVTAWYALVHLAPTELEPVLRGLVRALRRGGTLALATHVGARVERPGELFGRPTGLVFVLHDPDVVLEAAARAGLVDLEWYVRGPLGDEAPTRRLLLRGRRGDTP